MKYVAKYHVLFLPIVFFRGKEIRVGCVLLVGKVLTMLEKTSVKEG